MIVARIQYAVDGELRALGVSDASYFDIGNTAALERGVYWPLIDPGSEITWSEQARHAFHSQPAPLSIGELVLVNSSGFFDDWVDYQVKGFQTEIRRGSPNTPWADLEPVLVARNEALRFPNRSQMVITLGNVLQALASPWNTVVFEEGQANPRLDNTSVPAVLGKALQVNGLPVDPGQLRYVAAWNLGFVWQVAAGGNPITAWNFSDRGWILDANPTLTITGTISGPPVPIENVIDLAADAGDFTALTDLTDYTVVDNSPDATAVLTASPAEGLQLNIDASAYEFDFESFAGASERWAGGNVAVSTVGTGGQTLPIDDQWEFVDDPADETRYLRIAWGTGQAPGTLSNGVSFSGFTFTDLPDDAVIDYIEIDHTAELQTGFGVLDAGLEEIVIRKASGAVSANGIDGSSVNETAFTPVPTTTTTQTITTDSTMGLRLTGADCKQTGFQIRLRWRSEKPIPSPIGPVLNAVLHVYGIKFRVYLKDSGNVITLHTDLGMVPGNSYELQFDHDEDPAEIIARWAGVETATSPVEGQGDTFSTFQGRLTDDGESAFRFMADGPVLALGFACDPATDASQLIHSIRVIEVGQVVDRYAGLVPYIVDEAGLDPVLNVDQDSVDEHDTITGEMPTGWLVSNSESADDLLFLLASDRGGAVYHGLDAKVHSGLIRNPADVTDTLPAVGPERIDIDSAEIWDDLPPGITDRVQAARNWSPIPEDRAAGIVATFTEQDRADVSADYRITKKARFGDLQGFIEPEPVLTISAISPVTGDEAGGESVTITGTGFEAGATVTIGGASATSVVIDSATQITCDTPAGTAGDVDVVVTVGAESATLTDGFEFAGPWTPADETTEVWIKSDDLATITDTAGSVTQINDKSGNSRHYEQTTTALRPTTGVDTIGGKNVLRFDADWLRNTAAPAVWEFLNNADGFSVFAVIKPGLIANPDDLYGIFGNNGGSTFGRGMYVRYDDRSASSYSDTLVHVSADANNVRPVAHFKQDSAPAQTAIVLSIVSDPTLATAADRAPQWINGIAQTPIDTSLVNSSIVPVNAPTIRLELGAVGNGTWPLKGQIAEFVIMKGAASATLRQKFEGYLAHDWGLEGDLDVTHPHKATPP